MHHICEKSRVEAHGRYSDNMDMPALSIRGIQMASTLSIMFVSITSCERGLPTMLLGMPLKEFPVQNFFLKDSPDFDQSQSK